MRNVIENSSANMASAPAPSNTETTLGHTDNGNKNPGHSDTPPLEQSPAVTPAGMEAQSLGHLMARVFAKIGVNLRSFSEAVGSTGFSHDRELLQSDAQDEPCHAEPSSTQPVQATRGPALPGTSLSSWTQRGGFQLQPLTSPSARATHPVFSPRALTPAFHASGRGVFKLRHKATSNNFVYQSGLSLPTPAELTAWAAGMIDGDGCIHISKIKNTSKQRHSSKPSTARTEYFSLHLQISQNCLQTLGALQSILGGMGNIITVTNLPQHKSKHYSLNLSGKEAVKALMAVRPYLKRKQVECSLALMFDQYVDHLNANKHLYRRNRVRQELLDFHLCMQLLKR